MTIFNSSLQRFGEVSVRLSVELGRAQLPLREVLTLAEGSVVTLDRLTDELLDVTANGRIVARGEVIAQDGRFALRIVSLVDEASGGGARSNAGAGAVRASAAAPSPPSQTAQKQPAQSANAAVQPEPVPDAPKQEQSSDEPADTAQPDLDAELDAMLAEDAPPLPGDAAASGEAPAPEADAQQAPEA